MHQLNSRNSMFRAHALNPQPKGHMQMLSFDRVYSACARCKFTELLGEKGQ